MAIHNLINAPATVTLASGITAAATSLTVSANLGISAPFKATFASTGEIIEVGTAVGTAWSNIKRGAEGTTPAAYTTGSVVELRLTAGHLVERQPFNVYPSASASVNEANIAAAIASGYVSLAPGVYNVGSAASSGKLFTIAAATWFYGNGAVLLVASSVPATCDVFLISPTGGDPYYVAGNETMSNANFFDLIVASDGGARHAFHYDTTTWAVTRSRMERCRVYGVGGNAVNLTNPTRTDGFYLNTFRDCVWLRPCVMQRAGDSIVIDGVQCGKHNAVSFDISMVAGAGGFVISNCNSHGGAEVVKIVGSGFSTVFLHDNNFEMAAPPVDKGAVCYIEGGYLCNVSNNRFLTVYPAAGNLNGLQFVNSQRVTAVGNWLAGLESGYDLILDADSDLNYAPQASNICQYTRYSNTGTTRAGI